MATAYRSRNERLGEIVTVLGGGAAKGEKMTVHQLAKRMGMRASTHLRKMVYELIDSGVVRCEIADHRPNTQKLLLTLANPYPAQLELFR